MGLLRGGERNWTVGLRSDNSHSWNPCGSIKYIAHLYDFSPGGDKVASGKRSTRFDVIFKTIISIMVNRLFSYWLPFAGLLLSESTKKIDP